MRIKVNAKNRYKIEKEIEKVQNRSRVRLLSFDDIEKAVSKIYAVAPCKKSLAGVVISVCPGAFNPPSSYKYPAFATIAVLRFDGKGGTTLIDITRDYVTNNIITVEGIPDCVKFKDFLYNNFIKQISVMDLSEDSKSSIYPHIATTYRLEGLTSVSDYHEITISVGVTDGIGICNAVACNRHGDFSGIQIKFLPYTAVRMHVISDCVPVPDYYKHVGTVSGYSLCLYITGWSDMQSAIVETEGTPYKFELYRAGDTGFLCKAVPEH